MPKLLYTYACEMQVSVIKISKKNYCKFTFYFTPNFFSKSFQILYPSMR